MLVYFMHVKFYKLLCMLNFINFLFVILLYNS